jgi:hypothetical protein
VLSLGGPFLDFFWISFLGLLFAQKQTWESHMYCNGWFDGSRLGVLGLGYAAAKGRIHSLGKAWHPFKRGLPPALKERNLPRTISPRVVGRTTVKRKVARSIMPRLRRFFLSAPYLLAIVGLARKRGGFPGQE